VEAQWGDIQPFTEGNEDDYAAVAGKLSHIFAEAEAVFGERINDVTGEDLNSGFLDALLSRYGINLDDPSSLEKMDAVQRAAFFLDFYDGLMNFTQFDRVDHWMATVNWSPALMQSVGGGEGVHVGIVDFSLQDDFNLDIRGRYGYHGMAGLNHGYAVAGLIGAPFDGRDMMGVAPGVSFSFYNPFDETMTASWRDVRRGVRRLLVGRDRADIINLSLGVSGWTFHPKWRSVFGAPMIQWKGQDTLFVLAAGNNGVAQTTDVNWTGVSLVENLLIVGSVNPNGVISNFSNRPGTACLTVNGNCPEGHRLMDRFLVAPGELMLVWNGENGVIDGSEGLTRMSGTSFAAPLVTGAAALVKARWDWLEASDIANVLLWSAQDLGEEGVDEVYGWGLLDVDAALSPFDPADLVQFDEAGAEVAAAQAGLVPGGLDIQSGGLITLFEQIGEKYRDWEFEIEQLMAGADGAAQEADAESSLAENVYSFAQGTSFSDTVEYAATLTARGAFRVSAVASPVDPRERRTGSELPFQTGLRIEDRVNRREMRFGVGEGALAMSGQSGFGLFSDHRPETGGVNPVLGFASGGAYAMAGMSLDEEATLRIGVTTTRDERIFVNPFTGGENPLIAGLSPYAASALSMTLQRPVGEAVTVTANYTYLNEQTGFLGAQGAGYLALEGGAETDAVTFGAEARLGEFMTLSSSATFARTRATEFDGGVLSLGEATQSTAFQLTARRDGVFSGDDALRFSLIQPLHVESGAIDYVGARVIDRETGERAVETQSWSLEGERELRAEMLYATPVLQDLGELSLFGRVDLTETKPTVLDMGLVSGARFRMRF
jgi:hypothetical protein